MNVEEETLRRIMREEIRSAGIVTREELSSELDRRFGESDKKLDAKLDSRFDESDKKSDAKLNGRFDEFDKKLDAKLKAQDVRINARFDTFELNLAKFFGQTHKYFDARFNKFEQKFDKRFNALTNSVDGIIKRADDDDIECVAMNNQLNRHDRHIGELVKHANTTLSTL